MDEDLVSTVPAKRAGRQEWIGLAVIALPCVLYSMDLTVLHLAVPQLSAALQPSSSQLLWIVDIYGFLVAGFLITMGTLGDRIGRRKLLLLGAGVFGFASVLAAFATTPAMLIAARAFLGIAGATLAPSTLSLIRNMFADPGQRTTAIGVWAASFSLGGAIGPLAGGALLEHFWWGSVFLVGVPVMLVLLAAGPWLLPESRDPGAGRLDLMSVALSLGAVLPVIYGLKHLAEQGPGVTSVLSSLLGLGLGAVFFVRQKKLADPLIDLRLFRLPVFTLSLVLNGLSIFTIFGAFLYLAQYLQLVLGMSPLRAGLWTLPSAGGFVIGSVAVPVIARRIRAGVLIPAGLAMASIGFALVAGVHPSSGLGILVAGSIVFALGVAPAIILSTDLIVGSAPPEKAGAASAISETGAEFGGALGIAVLGSIGTAVYRSRLNMSLPTGMPEQTADAARDTLGGAVRLAGQLPDEAATALLSAAREAFTHGLRVASSTSAVLALGMAILATRFLRPVRPVAGAEPEIAAESPAAPDAALHSRPD